MKDDGQLVREFIAGEASAFEELVARHQSMVLGVCRRVTYGAEYAEDAAQATFLLLASRAEKLQSRTSIAGWLHHTAVNTAREARRSHVRRKRREERVMQEQEIGEDCALERKEAFHEILDSALARLSDSDRECLVLHYIEGVSQSELAEQLELEGGALTMRLSRARDRLRKLLRRLGLPLTGGAVAALLAVPLTAEAGAAFAAAAVVAGVQVQTVGLASAAGVSSQALLIAKGVMKGMLIKKLVLATTAAAASVLLGTLAYSQVNKPPPTPRTAPGPAPAMVRAPKPVQGSKARPADAVEVRKPKNPAAKPTIINAEQLPPDALFRLGSGSLSHGSWVNCVRPSPDGKWLVSGGRNGLLVLWNTESWKRVRTFRGHNGAVNSAAFSKDGKRLISGSEDKTAALWDVTNGERIHTFKGHAGSVSSVDFGPNGKLAITGGGLSDNTVMLWNVESGKPVATLKGHSAGVQCVTFSPDGKRALSGSRDKSIKLWDLKKGTQVRSFDAHLGTVNSIAFSRDGKRFISGSDDKKIFLWNIRNGEQLKTYHGHTRQVKSVAFSEDGKRVLSGGSDKNLMLWDVATTNRIHRIPNGSIVNSVAFASNEERIVSGGWTNSLNLWSTQTGQRIRAGVGHSDSVGSLAFSPEGDRIMSASKDKTLRLWKARTGEQKHTFSLGASELAAITFSPDAKLLAGANYKTVVIRKVAVGEGASVRSFKGHSRRVLSTAFSPDSKRIASGSKVGQIIIWDVETGRKVHALDGNDRGSALALAFSPDGKQLICACGSGHLVLWDVETGKRIRTFSRHSGYVASVAFSPNGKQIVSSCADVAIWDVSTGKRVRTFEPGSGRVAKSATFSPDGQQVLATTGDGAIVFWNVNSWDPAHTLKGHAGGLTSISFSPGGRRIVSGSTDTTAIVWQPFLEEKAKAEKWAQNIAALPATDRTAHYQALFQKLAAADYREFCQTRERIIASGPECLDLLTTTFPPGAADPSLAALRGLLLLCDIGDLDRLWFYAMGPNGSYGTRIARRAAGLSGNALLSVGTGIKDCQILSVSNDGKYVLMAGLKNEITVWDASILAKRKVIKLTGQPQATVFAPNDKTMAVAMKGGRIQVQSILARKPEIVVLRKKGPNVNAMCFASDGKKLAVAYADRTVQILSVPAGKVLAAAKTVTEPNCLALSRDGTKIACGSGNGDVVLFDAVNLKQTNILKGHVSTVNRISFSPDGTYVISGGLDQTLRLWRSDGTFVRSFTGHTSVVTGAAFLRGSAIVVSASMDGSFRVWGSATGELIRATESLDNGIAHMRVSGDCGRVVLMGRDGRIFLSHKTLRSTRRNTTTPQNVAKETTRQAEIEPPRPRKSVLEKAVRAAIGKPRGRVTKSDLRKVTCLVLNEPGLTDKDLNMLASFPNLTSLSFAFSSDLSPDHIAQLSRCKRLVSLSLEFSQITGKHLKNVTQIKKLTALGLTRTGAPDKAVTALKAALPKCSIVEVDLPAGAGRSDALKKISAGWLQKDLQLAVTLARMIRMETTRSEQLYQMVRALTKSSPAKAEELAKSIENEKSRMQAFFYMAVSLPAEHSKRAETLARSIKEKDDRETALSSLAANLAHSGKFEDAGRITLLIESKWQRSSRLQYLVRKWHAKSPKGVKAWVKRLPAEERKPLEAQIERLDNPWGRGGRLIK